MNFVYLLAVFLLFTGGPQQAHKQSDEIDEDDLRNYLAKQNGCEYDQIYFEVLEQVDFLSFVDILVGLGDVSGGRG